MKLPLEMAIILAVALGLAGASHWLRPDALPWEADSYEIDLRQALSMSDALWVDARAEAEQERGTYPGAIALNEEDWEEGFARLLDVWQPGQPIIAFCGDDACVRSRSVAERLRRDLGEATAYSLRDGWSALRAAGLVKEPQ